MLLQEILLVRLFPMQRMFARDVLDVTVRTVFLALHMCSSQTPPHSMLSLPVLQLPAVVEA